MNVSVMKERGLDDFGILRGTDKSSLGSDYLRHYEHVLGHLRHEPITLLEIGIWNGASLRMWEDYFEKASIVGVDIRPVCVEYSGGRREVEIGSQADAAFLNDLGKRRRPHVIVDDGSHQASHVILTFRALFQYLQPGGFYIVEDLYLHAGPGAGSYRGTSEIAPQDILLRLARLVVCPATDGDEEREWARQVDTVEFFRGCVVIRKQPPGSLDTIARRRALVEETNTADAWSLFALHAWSRTGDLADAKRCAQRGIDLAPDASFHWHVLSRILEDGGDIVGAAEASEKAAALMRTDGGMQARAATLRKRVADGK